MPRRHRVKTTKVTALLPYSVDLTKLRSNNTLDIQVRSGEEFLGTLKMGRGSVQWWPSNNKTHALRKHWRHFAEVLTRSMAKGRVTLQNRRPTERRPAGRGPPYLPGTRLPAIQADSSFSVFR